MGKFDFLKGFGKAVLPLLEQMFPAIKMVEALSKFKSLTSKEKQDLAFDLVKNDFINSLLPEEAKKFSGDPVFESKVRQLIDLHVDLINYVQGKK